MKQLCSATILVSCLFSTASAQPLIHRWSTGYPGGYGSQDARAVAMQGFRIALVGSFRGAIDFGGEELTLNDGYDDVFVAVFDAAGGHIWSRSFGDINHLQSFQDGQDVAIDAAGNVAITGETCCGTVDFGGGPIDGEAFVAKFDPAGNHIWSHGFGDIEAFEHYESRAVGLTNDGSVVIAGSFPRPTDFGDGVLTPSGPRDAFVAKFDAAGNIVWSRQFGISYSESVTDLDVDAAGNVVIAVRAWGTTPLSGRMSLVRYRSDGVESWSRSFGSGYDGALASSLTVAFDAAGNVVFSGHKDSPSLDFGGGPIQGGTVFLAKFDAAGGHLWSHAYGQVEEIVVGASVDPSGQITLAGYFLGGTANMGGDPLPLHGTFDVFAARYDVGGNHTWSTRYGGSSFEDAAGLAAGPNTVMLCGTFRDSTELGGGTLYGNGTYLARFNTQDPVGVEPIPLDPASTGLRPSRITPDGVAITFGIASAQPRVAIDIFDIRGHLIRRLYRGDAGAAVHELTWNARDDNAVPVASGVYVVRLQTGATVSTQKALWLRP